MVTEPLLLTTLTMPPGAMSRRTSLRVSAPRTWAVPKARMEMAPIPAVKPCCFIDVLLTSSGCLRQSPCCRHLVQDFLLLVSVYQLLARCSVLRVLGHGLLGITDVGVDLTQTVFVRPALVRRLLGNIAHQLL